MLRDKSTLRAKRAAVPHLQRALGAVAAAPVEVDHSE